MRVWVLTILTMIAFAANSFLTRLAIDKHHIDPASFALFRVFAGAVVLSVLAFQRAETLKVFHRDRFLGASALTIYMVGFSFAYITLDAGLGALILFGVTQLAMFGYGSWAGLPPNRRQIVGSSIAFIGLMVVLWPNSGGGTDTVGALWMVVGGLGWGVYSILGGRARDPLGATGLNFLLCLPLLLILLVGFTETITTSGVALARLCGGVTSGLGYALWYSVLRHSL